MPACTARTAHAQRAFLAGDQPVRQRAKPAEQSKGRCPELWIWTQCPWPGAGKRDTLGDPRLNCRTEHLQTCSSATPSQSPQDREGVHGLQTSAQGPCPCHASWEPGCSSPRRGHGQQRRGLVEGRNVSSACGHCTASWPPPPPPSQPSCWWAQHQP